MIRSRNHFVKVCVLTLAAVVGLCVATPVDASTNSSDTTSDSSDVSVAEEVQPKTTVPVISRVRTKDKVVFITMDDGFSPTPQLAKIIRKHKVPITTFAMPRQVKRNWKWFKKQTNMTFENHTVNHRSMTPFRLRGQMKEICGANRQIEDMVDDAPQYFRPPGGNWSEITQEATARCGLSHVVMWSVIAEKGKLRMPKGRLLRGDIILMHYIPSAAPTLELLLQQIKAQGLRPALLRDYLK